jgi:hypothetical protein
MSRPNDWCTSTSCSMAPFGVRHYRWQCGSDVLDRPGIEVMQRSAAALSNGVQRSAVALANGVRDWLANSDKGAGRR